MTTLLAIDHGSITTVSDVGNVAQLTFNITTANAFEFIFVDITWCSTSQTAPAQGVSDPMNGPYVARYNLGPFIMQAPMFNMYMARFYTPSPVGAMTFPVTAVLNTVPTNGFCIQAYAFIGTNQQNPFDPSGTIPVVGNDPGPAFTTPTLNGVSTAAQANDVLLWQFATKSTQVGNVPNPGSHGTWSNIATNEVAPVAFTAESDYLIINSPAQSITLTSQSTSSWIAVADALTDPPLYLAYGLAARRRM